MRLENRFKKQDSIRRKAYHVDNPELRFACTGLSTFKTFGLAM